MVLLLIFLNPHRDKMVRGTDEEDVWRSGHEENKGQTIGAKDCNFSLIMMKGQRVQTTQMYFFYYVLFSSENKKTFLLPSLVSASSPSSSLCVTHTVFALMSCRTKITRLSWQLNVYLLRNQGEYSQPPTALQLLRRSQILSDCGTAL